VTNGTLVALALGATGLLALGARLLEDSTTASLIVATVALTLGTALAAAAVAGAWRAPRSDRGADEVAHDAAASPSPLGRR
jgi:hypothetical protein